jgi:hypothetical protein
VTFKFKEAVTLEARYEGMATPVEVSFMCGLLDMDPATRFTAQHCLLHPYLAQEG